LTYDIA